MNITDPIRLIAIHKLMEYGIVKIINLHKPTQEWLLEDSKPRRHKYQRPEDRRLDQWISRSIWKHYCTTVCALSNTRMEILKSFRNWIIIFITDQCCWMKIPKILTFFKKKKKNPHKSTHLQYGYQMQGIFKQNAKMKFIFTIGDLYFIFTCKTIIK